VHSTSQTFRHGPDVPITRANIAREQRWRVKHGHPPADPEAVVAAFVSLPKPHHLARAYRLMGRPTSVPVVKESA
jgi:hypothetical protein